MNPARALLPRRHLLDGKIADRIASGQADENDVDLLYSVARQMQNRRLCALGEFSIEAVVSGIDKFRPDYVNERQLRGQSAG